MGILADRPQTLTAYREARVRALGYVAGSPVLLLLIMLLPKDAGMGSLRLGLALLFFVTAIFLLWGLMDAVPAFLRSWVDLALEDMGDEHQILGRAVVDSLARWLGMLAAPPMLAITFAALWVTAAWPIGDPIRSLSFWLHLGIWGMLAVTLVVLFRTTHRLNEIRIIFRAFQRQISQSGYRVITPRDANMQEAQLNGPAVEVTGPYRFRAGGAEWSWSDFQQSCVVFGQSGSGKTITVLNTLLEGLLTSTVGQPDVEPAAALILDPKGDYRTKIAGLCARLGRADDLVILDPHDPVPVRWNPLDTSDAPLEVSGRFAMVMKLLGTESKGETFWIDNAQVFFEHAIGLLRATLPTEQPPSLPLVNDLATQPAVVEARLFFLHASRLLATHQDDAFITPLDLAKRVEPHNILARIPAESPSADALHAFFGRWAAKTEDQRAAVCLELETAEKEMGFDPSIELTLGSEAQLAAKHMVDVWLVMPEKTRSSVMPHLNNMLNAFLAEPYRTAFAGKSELRLDEALRLGKIVYVAMPAQERPVMAQTVNALIKIDYQRQVLMNRRKSRYSLFFCDEFQSFMTMGDKAGDSHFFALSRESRHANVIATQNLSGLYARVDDPNTVKSLLANCAVKLFLRNTDDQTLDYASEVVFGSYTASITTVSRSGGGHGGRVGFSESVSFNEAVQVLPRVNPERLRRLAIANKDEGPRYSEVYAMVGSRGSANIERLLLQVNSLT